MSRESMQFDVIIVGGGPSGLSAAIKLKQLANANNKDLSVCLIDKGSEIGAHLLSGAVFEPRSLNELIPDWKKLGAPLKVKAKSDSFLFMTENKSYKLPTPPQMHNEGNYIISLVELGKWLATQAEALGVEIYPGFAAAEILYDEASSEDSDEASNEKSNRVIGVATGDMGIGKDGQKTDRFEPGIELHAKQTLFAEGCRGSLSQQLMVKFDLRKDTDPQTYALGIKEIWEIDPKKHDEGHIMHAIGWPMDYKTYGGAWLYHWDKNRISIGYVVALDYENPYLSPFHEFQKFKLHPDIKPLLEGGKRIAYGARTLNEGGLQSLPKLTFPGGALIGDAAGFLNVAKIKGNHTAMKSGMLAAESLFEHLFNSESDERHEATSYGDKFRESWMYQELHAARNIRPSFHWGLYTGLIYSAIDTYLFRGNAPWTFKNHADHTQLKHKEGYQKIDYPKPDNKITFDRLSSVFLTNTNHEENQPSHLTLKDNMLPMMRNLSRYDGPEQRYCPAQVYEFVFDENNMNPYLQINAQNCIHCKACDIKDPEQNIVWKTPEGGGGPNYLET